MAETLSQEDIKELILILNVALSDVDTAISQSHDFEEVQAYNEHEQLIRKWIHRLSQHISQEE